MQRDSIEGFRLTKHLLPPGVQFMKWGVLGDGASEGIRTLDIHLGKVTLYQAELRSRSKAPR